MTHLRVEGYAKCHLRPEASAAVLEQNCLRKFIGEEDALMPANTPRAKQIRQDSLKQFLSAFGMSEDKTKRALELQKQTGSAQNIHHVLESGNPSDAPHATAPVGERKVLTSQDEDEQEQSSSTRPPSRGP